MWIHVIPWAFLLKTLSISSTSGGKQLSAFCFSWVKHFSLRKFDRLNVAQQKMMTDDDHDDRPCWSKSADLIFCSPCAVLKPLIPGRSKNFECRTTLKDQHLRFISIPYTVAFNGGNWRRCSVYSNLTSSLDFQPAAVLQAPNILFRKGWEGQSSCCKGSLLPRVSLLYIPSTHTWFLRHTNEAFWTHLDYIDVVCSELESVQQNEQPVRKYAQGNKIYTTLLSCFDWSLLCPSQSAKLKLHEVSEIEIENQKRFEKNWIGCH